MSKRDVILIVLLFVDLVLAAANVMVRVQGYEKNTAEVLRYARVTTGGGAVRS